MESNSARRTVPPSCEMSPPRTRRESVLEVENMSVRDLERHIAELHRSIVAMRELRGRTIPQWDLSPASDDIVMGDHRLSSRLTSTAYDNRSVPARGTVEAVVPPSASVRADQTHHAAIADASGVSRPGAVDERERRLPSVMLDRPTSSISTSDPETLLAVNVKPIDQRHAVLHVNEQLLNKAA